MNSSSMLFSLLSFRMTVVDKSVHVRVANMFCLKEKGRRRRGGGNDQ